MQPACSQCLRRVSLRACAELLADGHDPRGPRAASAPLHPTSARVSAASRATDLPRMGRFRSALTSRCPSQKPGILGDSPLSSLPHHGALGLANAPAQPPSQLLGELSSGNSRRRGTPRTGASLSSGKGTTAELAVLRGAAPVSGHVPLLCFLGEGKSHRRPPPCLWAGWEEWRVQGLVFSGGRWMLG